MSVQITAATTGRIVRQLRHDRRTVAMLIVVPAVLLAVLYFMYDDAGTAFDRVALVMLGIFPFVIMFLVTSIAMLRERTTGTLERLLALFGRRTMTHPDTPAMAAEDRPGCADGKAAAGVADQRTIPVAYQEVSLTEEAAEILEKERKAAAERLPRKIRRVADAH